VTKIHLVETENQNEAAIHQRQNLNQENDNECGKYFFLAYGWKSQRSLCLKTKHIVTWS